MHSQKKELTEMSIIIYHHALSEEIANFIIIYHYTLSEEIANRNHHLSL